MSRQVTGDCAGLESATACFFVPSRFLFSLFVFPDVACCLLVWFGQRIARAGCPYGQLMIIALNKSYVRYMFDIL